LTRVSILDSAIAAIAPGWALARTRSRLQLDMLRGYDAAQGGRRTSSFRRGAGSPNAELSRALPSLRERSRELCRNAYIGRRTLDILTTHSVGTDLTIRFDTGSGRADAAAQALWAEWTTQCDVEGETVFNGLLALALRSALEGGDSLIRFIDRPLSRRLAVPLQLHVGEGDLIDEGRDRSRSALGSARARLGVELGDHDERLGYWLFDEMPGEGVSLSPLRSTSQLVAREDVCHIYRRERPGQLRGAPVFAPVLMAARDYADLMDALVVKARMEACIGLIVKGAGQARSIGEKVDDTGGRISQLRPGAVQYLNDGEDAVPFSPASNTAFDPISRATLMGISAGVGITYDQLTGDPTAHNFSSLRAVRLEFKRNIADIQWHWLMPQAIDRIVARFIDRAILSGRLPARREGYRYQAVMPAFEAIDPIKEMEADILAVRAGRMSPQDFIEMWGRDHRVVMKEFEDFYALADAAKAVFDIDARQRTRSGNAVTAGSPGEAQQDAPA
jgi:lambda family phage portal protein